jgi:hypothetical protein
VFLSGGDITKRGYFFQGIFLNTLAAVGAAAEPAAGDCAEGAGEDAAEGVGGAAGSGVGGGGADFGATTGAADASALAKRCVNSSARL